MTEIRMEEDDSDWWSLDRIIEWTMQQGHTRQEAMMIVQQFMKEVPHGWRRNKDALNKPTKEKVT